LFIPLVKPLDEVKKDRRIGEVSRDLINFSVIKSPAAGIIMRVSPHKFVDTGDELASVGKVEGWVE